MAEIARYDQKIDGKWYRVGDELPSEKPVSGAVEKVAVEKKKVTEVQKNSGRKKV